MCLSAIAKGLQDIFQTVHPTLHRSQLDGVCTAERTWTQIRWVKVIWRYLAYQTGKLYPCSSGGCLASSGLRLDMVVGMDVEVDGKSFGGGD